MSYEKKKKLKRVISQRVVSMNRTTTHNAAQPDKQGAVLRINRFSSIKKAA